MDPVETKMPVLCLRLGAAWSQLLSGCLSGSSSSIFLCRTWCFAAAEGLDEEPLSAGEELWRSGSYRMATGALSAGSAGDVFLVI